MSVDLLDRLIGNRTHLAVLRTLKPHHKGLTGRAVAKQASVSVQAAQNALAVLEQMGLVRWQPAGRSHLYQLNRQHALYTKVLAPFFEHRESYLQSLKDDLVAAAGTKAISVTLFGSTARGSEQPGSDIDLLVVVADIPSKMRTQDKLIEYTDHFDKKYHGHLAPIVMTRQECLRKSASGSALIRYILAQGKTLSGVALKEIVHAH